MISIFQGLMTRMREIGIELTNHQRDFIDGLPGKDYSGDALGYRRAMDQTLAMAMILTAIKTEEGKDMHEQG